VPAIAIPIAEHDQNDHRRQRHESEPNEATSPVRQNDKGRQHRADRAAEAAAELEQRLRHAVRAT